MNNSEAIKRFNDKFKGINIQAYMEVNGEAKSVWHELEDFILSVRSEAFEEAIQALPEKKTLDQQAMEVLDNIGKLPLCYSRNIRNELLDEIKGILMQLKGKNG